MLPSSFGRESCGSVAVVVVNSGGGAAGGVFLFFFAGRTVAIEAISGANEVSVYGLVIWGYNPMTNA